MATIRALECLLAIAETGSLTAAAARLHLTQPALSHQVRMLEQEIGAPVVDRLPHGVELTAAGSAMIDTARSVVFGLTRAIALGKAVVAGEGGSLRIGCTESIIAGVLAPALSSWRRKHPHVTVELLERASAEDLATDVLLGDADLAIGPAPAHVGLEVVPLLHESFSAIVADGHPLADRTNVSLRELALHPVVHLDASNEMSRWLDAVATAAGIVLQPSIRVRNTSTIPTLAIAGLGIGVISRSATPPPHSRIIPLEPPLTREIVAMHKTTVQPLVGAFCEILRTTSTPERATNASDSLTI